MYADAYQYGKCDHVKHQEAGDKLRRGEVADMEAGPVHAQPKVCKVGLNHRTRRGVRLLEPDLSG